MKLSSYSTDLGHLLLDIGYMYFVVSAENSTSDDHNPLQVLKAVEFQPMANSILITHVMNMTEDKTSKYFVMYEDIPTLKQAQG